MVLESNFIMSLLIVMIVTIWNMGTKLRQIIGFNIPTRF